MVTAVQVDPPDALKWVHLESDRSDESGGYLLAKVSGERGQGHSR